MVDSKIVDSEEFLRKYEEKFGKHAGYFQAATVMRATPATEVPSGNPSSVADDDSSSSEELVHREEVFERIAFEAARERDLLKFVFTHHFEPCDVCIYRKGAEDPDCELECDVCGKCNCPCKNCWISGCDENFVIDEGFVEEKMRKDEEK